MHWWRGSRPSFHKTDIRDKHPMRGIHILTHVLAHALAMMDGAHYG